jgi:hypothetical protein
MKRALSSRTIAAAALVSFLCFGFAQPQAAVNPKAVDLGALLGKTADYCRKLEGSILDFVCLEEIRETIDPTADVLQANYFFGGNDWGWRLGDWTGASRQPKKIKNSYLYDYQCVRSGQAVRETRTLLKENGKKMNVPNAALKTSVVVYGTVLMGPVGLLGERFQPQYDFSVVGREKIGKRPVVVVDAKPKPDAPETTNLYGKAWIDPATADILKIEWSESRVGRRQIFDKRGERYKRKPRLTILSEFRTERNGIRFPTSLVIEEAYVNEKGKAFVRSKTEVAYKDFKFFTVEVQSRITEK